MTLQEMWWSMAKILWHFNRASQLHTIYDEFEGMDPRPRTLCYYLHKNTTHGMCHHVFMYDGRDKYTNSQTNSSIKYISNEHGVWCKMKSIEIR